MADSDRTMRDLLHRAREGDREALGELLDAHRAYLKILSRRKLDGKLGARLDESDLIQQTCLSVHRNLKNFRGTDQAEFVAWLKRIHEQNLHNVIRDHVYAQKRAVGRELDKTTPNEQDDDRHPAEITTPSARAMRGEQAVQLARAMQSLPDDQCEAVRLRYLEGCSLVQIAEKMQRSESAAVGLLKRGMQKLRHELCEQ